MPVFEWEGPDEQGVRTAVYEGRSIAVWPVGHRRGWKIQIDQEVDRGLTGCGKRAPSSWTGIRPMIERTVLARLGDEATDAAHLQMPPPKS